MRGLTLVASVAVCAGVSVARADLVFFGSQGHRSAQVAFRIVETDLEVTLTNTAQSDATRSDDILTAVFFDFVGHNPSLTRQSATVAAGSQVLFSPTGPDTNVGGEWAYRGNIFFGLAAGISASSYGLFGSQHRFPGPNLQGPSSPDGIQYGLTSAGDNPTTGNSSVSGNNAIIQNSVVFRLGDLPSGFGLDRIRGVLFQYGTSIICDPHFHGQVPSPGTAAILGLAGLFAARRRRFA